MRNQKVINILLALLLSGLILGCSNAANNDDNKTDDKSGTKILWENKENGYSEKVELGEGSEDGLHEKIIWYSIVEDATGKGLAFIISRIESNNNVIYKGAIIAKQKNEAFSQDYWTHYKISCGQNTISMSNVVHGADVENGEYEFLIVGGISEIQLNELKNANVINISLENENDSERNTSFYCNSNFVLNLIKHF